MSEPARRPIPQPPEKLLLGNVLDLGRDGWIVRTVNYIPYDPLHPARDTTMERYWSQWRRNR